MIPKDKMDKKINQHDSEWQGYFMKLSVFLTGSDQNCSFLQGMLILKFGRPPPPPKKKKKKKKKQAKKNKLTIPGIRAA